MLERDWSKPLNLELVEEPPVPMELPLMMRHFGGVESMKTHDRLNTLWYRVFNLMKDGKWRTLMEISQRTGGTQTWVSARLRDCRKTGFGNHKVHRAEEAPGLFRYQLELNPKFAEDEARRYFHAKHPGAKNP